MKKVPGLMEACTKVLANETLSCKGKDVKSALLKCLVNKPYHLTVKD